jgi:hypothetical protein
MAWGKITARLLVFLVAWIIHECRREAFETKARRGFSQVRPTQAYRQSVEEAEREKPRRARGSDDVVGILEWSGLESSTSVADHREPCIELRTVERWPSGRRQQFAKLP